MNTEIILTLNCGSSSIKFALMHPKTEQTISSGLVEKLGTADVLLHWHINNKKNIKIALMINFLFLYQLNIRKTFIIYMLYDNITCIWKIEKK